MKLLSAPRVLPPVVVAVVLGAVYALAAFTRPVALGTGGQPAPSRSLAVNSVIRACPAPGNSGAGTVALIAAPATAGSGRAQVIPLGSAGNTPIGAVSQPGQLTDVRAPAVRRSARAGSSSASAGGLPAPVVAAPGGVMVQASGAMARGLEVEQVASGSTSSARCESPGTDFWFVGPGQRLAGRIQLYLMNPGGQAADVNVAISTDAGPRQGGADTGISVAPHSMVVQSIGAIVRGSNVAALHVTTTVGQVVAAEELISGGGRTGGWLPAAQEPANVVVIPGMPGSAGSRELYVAVPGAQDAHLRLTAVTTRGAYEPTGGGSLDIPGGTAVAIPLSSMAGIPAALKLTASVPVTASVMLPGGPPGAPGVLSAATPALAEQGVIALDHSGGGTTSQLVLSAPGGAVNARIWVGSSWTAGKTQEVRVAAGHSLVVQLGKIHAVAHGGGYAVVVTPLAGSGPLYVGRAMIGGGSLDSILPVSSALTVVPLPFVQPAFIASGR